MPKTWCANAGSFALRGGPGASRSGCSHRLHSRAPFVTDARAFRACCDDEAFRRAIGPRHLSRVMLGDDRKGAAGRAGSSPVRRSGRHPAWLPAYCLGLRLYGIRDDGRLGWRGLVRWFGARLGARPVPHPDDLP
jgi:hypothetical protein